MKKYQISQFICFFIIFCLGAALMIYPSLGFKNINQLFFLIMLIYGFLSYVLYMLIRRKDDYEYLYISLASVIIAMIEVFLPKENVNLVLSLSLVGWMSLVAIIKLIKVDYYHDRNDILWFVRSITFVLFLIIGTLTAVNLYYNIEVQSLMLGFFLISVSILEVFDPVADFLVNHKIKKITKNIKPITIKEKVEVKPIKESKIVKSEVKTKPKTVSSKSKNHSSSAKKTTAKSKTTSAGKKKTSSKKTTTKPKSVTKVSSKK